MTTLKLTLLADRTTTPTQRKRAPLVYGHSETTTTPNIACTGCDAVPAHDFDDLHEKIREELDLGGDADSIVVTVRDWLKSHSESPERPSSLAWMLSALAQGDQETREWSTSKSGSNLEQLGAISEPSRDAPLDSFDVPAPRTSTQGADFDD